MEPAEMISEQWCSLSGLYTAKEADFMSQLLGNCLLPEQLYENSNFRIESSFWPTANESSIVSVQGSLDSKHINEIENNTDLVDTGKDDVHVPDDKMAPSPKKRENEILVSEQERNREVTGKISRSSNEVPKNKRNVKSKKNMRYAASQDETLSSTCCSDDDSNASQNDSTALKSSRKSRGSATDPQSLYARRRRERINERLRILQNIVPNGTKVDISTMLEEAVQYVKFLQLQIKLLSSDDMWMYAPISYNGMNIGLQLSITPITKEPKEDMMHGIGIAIKENASD